MKVQDVMQRTVKPLPEPPVPPKPDPLPPEPIPPETPPPDIVPVPKLQDEQSMIAHRREYESS